MALISNMGEGFRLLNIALDAQIVGDPFFVAVERHTMPEQAAIQTMKQYLFERPVHDKHLRAIIATVSSKDRNLLLTNSHFMRIGDGRTSQEAREALMLRALQFLGNIKDRCHTMVRRGETVA